MIFYEVTNNKNPRKWIAKTNDKTAEENFNKHLTLLSQSKHYIPLLQKDYNNGATFKITNINNIEDSTVAFKEAYNLMVKENTLNPQFGYNTLMDLNDKNKNRRVLNALDEDLLTSHLLNLKDKYDISTSALSHRLIKSGLKQGRDKIKLGSYDAILFKVEEEIILSSEPLTTGETLNILNKKYDISSKLRLSQKRITKKMLGKKLGMCYKNKVRAFYDKFNEDIENEVRTNNIYT